jgi:hypothetical protein
MKIAMKEKRKKFTFIKAFESSPVHCAKSRPSGKRRSPGNGGTAEILEKMQRLDLCKGEE